MTRNRRTLPSKIKREVRQRCGFGCIFCGLPVYHYDHIREYSATKRHEADNITLLCGTHHDLKTRKQLPVKKVLEQNQEPFNKTRNHTSPHPLYYSRDQAEIIAGGNTVAIDGGQTSAIKIDGHSLVDFEMIHGNLVLNMNFQDRAGRPILTVRQNELVHSNHL